MSDELYRFKLFFEHLLLREVRVVATGFDQLRMRTLLHDPSLFEHYDAIECAYVWPEDRGAGNRARSDSR